MPVTTSVHARTVGPTVARIRVASPAGQEARKHRAECSNGLVHYYLILCDVLEALEMEIGQIPGPVACLVQPDVAGQNRGRDGGAEVNENSESTIWITRIVLKQVVGRVRVILWRSQLSPRHRGWQTAADSVLTKRW